MRYWTYSEIEFLKNNYGKMSLGKMSKILRRSKKSICEKARELGLTNKRMPKYLIRIYRR